MAAGLLGVPRKVDQKGGKFKNPEGGSDEANQNSPTVLIELCSSKGRIADCQFLKQDDGRVKRTKTSPLRKGSVTIP